MNSILIEIDSLDKHHRASDKKHIQSMLADSGLEKVKCVKISTLFRLEGPVPARDIEKIASELLCDPVVEIFSVDSRPADGQTLYADVWYKPGVTDAVGDSVVKAARDLETVSVERAFSGTRYAFSSPALTADAEEKILNFVTHQLLNPLVQECKIVKR